MICLCPTTQKSSRNTKKSARNSTQPYNLPSSWHPILLRHKDQGPRRISGLLGARTSRPARPRHGRAPDAPRLWHRIQAGSRRPREARAGEVGTVVKSPVRHTKFAPVSLGIHSPAAFRLGSPNTTSKAQAKVRGVGIPFDKIHSLCRRGKLL